MTRMLLQTKIGARTAKFIAQARATHDLGDQELKDLRQNLKQWRCVLNDVRATAGEEQIAAALERIWGRVEDVPELRTRLEVVSDQLAKLIEFHKTGDAKVMG